MEYQSGLEVADAVDGDIVVARKIGLPWQPELGIGAVTADGPPILDHHVQARSEARGRLRVGELR